MAVRVVDMEFVHMKAGGLGGAGGQAGNRTPELLLVFGHCRDVQLPWEAGRGRGFGMFVI